MIRKLLALANELDRKNSPDLSDRIDVLTRHRKERSPISRQNLVHYYNGLVKMLDSDVGGSREYAAGKLREFEPLFRKYCPELFQEQLIKISGYSSELGMLKNVLKEGFDPYDYQPQLSRYLSQNFGDDVDLSDFEYAEEWLDQASPEQLKEFQDWIGENYGDTDYYSPAYEIMDYRGMSKPKWQVHFTNDPFSIVSSGFIYGHPNVEGVHLTTNKMDRQSKPGYNFSFDADSFPRHNNSNYGDHAVVFFSGAIDTYHHGDMEHQNIFWGPNVDPEMIFPVNKEYDEWVVRDWNDREVFKSKELRDCVGWIERNWQQLKTTRTKYESPYNLRMTRIRKKIS